MYYSKAACALLPSTHSLNVKKLSGSVPCTFNCLMKCPTARPSRSPCGKCLRHPALEDDSGVGLDSYLVVLQEKGPGYRTSM